MESTSLLPTPTFTNSFWLILGDLITQPITQLTKILLHDEDVGKSDSLPTLFKNVETT